MINKKLSSILSAALFILFISPLFTQLFSQEVVMDSIITGNKYRLTLFNDKEVIGRVAKQDSIYVYVVTEEGTVRVRFDDIFSVSKSAIPRVMLAMFTLGGGIYLNGGDYNDYPYNDDNKPGLSTQVTGLFPFGENKAIRVDLGFNRITRKAYDYYYYSSSYSNYTEQNIDIYNLYAQFVFGNFNTKTNFSVYGLAGVGIMHISEGSYTNTGYNYYDSSYYSYTYPGENYTNFSLAIGGGLRFKLYKQLGLFTEAQYHINTYQGFFWFFGRGYFPVRAGITYMLY